MVDLQDFVEEHQELVHPQHHTQAAWRLVGLAGQEEADPCTAVAWVVVVAVVERNVVAMRSGSSG